MCRVLGLSRSGYYAWCDRADARAMRRREDAELAREIDEVFVRSRRTYGSPRIRFELLDRGYRVGRERIARVMNDLGLCAQHKKRFRVTTKSDHGKNVADNVLNREFRASAPNTSWVADITYVDTREGWLYLAVIIDLFSRRVVGWNLENHMRASLATGALGHALDQREIGVAPLHHSDRGSQYASHEYRSLLAKHGIRCSMSRKANCWDNAVAESFFGTIKQELLHRRRWPTKREARKAIFDYIEVFYNRKRRHSSLGYLSPADFEKRVA